METAIVMPLFLFILLGVVQLSLLHQARYLTKYAAYKAARAGAIRGADPAAMERAALAVMTPMLSKGDGKTRLMLNASDSGAYTNSFQQAESENQGGGLGGQMKKKLVEVTQCAPIGNGAMNKDFDDPDVNTDDWRGFDATKLAVQVTTYYGLVIPFANQFVWWAARGEGMGVASGRTQTMRMLRMKTGDTSKASGEEREKLATNNGRYDLKDLESEAQKGNYIMPVRQAFAMRMHSNFKQNPPGKNDCQIPWKRKN